MYMLPQSSQEPYGEHHQPHVTDKERMLGKITLPVSVRPC